MSYGMSCDWLAHSDVGLAGAPGIGGLSARPPGPGSVGGMPPLRSMLCPPENTCTCPVDPGPATYSDAGSPMRRIRHSSESAEPVETAMSGMLSSVSPGATVDGSVSDLSGSAFAWHAVTGTCSERRHLPT